MRNINKKHFEFSLNFLLENELSKRSCNSEHMDLSFDSDSQIFHDEQNFNSDIDTKTITNQEIASYQEAINDLKKQNLVLKAQFEQAVTVAKKVDNVHEENFKLSNQVRNLQLENENLQCRLQILLHNNEELENQNNNYKSLFTQQMLQANSDKEIEVSKTQKICNGKIDSLLIRINQSEEAKEKSILEVKMLKSKIDRMLQSANDCFKIKFEEIETFIDFLNQTSNSKPSNIDINNNDILINQQQQQIQCLPEKTYKNKNDKKKIKSLKNQSKKLVLEINRLQSKIDQLESEHSKQIKDYQNECQKLKDDLEMSQTESKESIRLLKEQNQTLKCKFIKLRKEAVEIQTQMLTNQANININTNTKPKQKEIQVPSNTKSKSENKELIESLQKENKKLIEKVDDLKNKVNKIEDEKIELIDKLKEVNNLNENLQISIDQFLIEKKAYEALKKQNSDEIKNLRERLKSKEEVSKPKQEVIEKYKDEIIKLETLVKSQSDELQSLNLQKQNYSFERSNMLSKSQKLQDENEELKTKLVALNEELNELNDKLANKPEIKVEDVLPGSAFRFKDFDPSLSQQIEQVGFNQYLSPQSKLNKIYNLILNHYNAILKEKSDLNQHMTEHLEIVKKKLNSFLVDLSIGLSFNALTFDDFLSFGGQKLIDKAVSSLKSVDDLKRKNSQLFSIVSQISGEFGLPYGTDVYSQISFLSQSITSHFSNSRQTDQKYNELKRRNKTSKRSFVSKITSLEQYKCEMIKKYQEIQIENEGLNKKNQELKKELHLCKLKLSSLKESTKQNEENLRDENQSILDDMTKRFLSEKAVLNSQIEKMKNENEKAKLTISDTESSCGKLRALIEKHRNEIKKHEDEIEVFKKEKEIEIAALNEKFINEKKQLTQSFEKAINEIQIQCENQRIENSKLSQKVNSKKSKCDQLLSSLAQLKRENQKLENNLKSLEDQLSRERVVSDTSLKNQIMSIESKCTQQLHEANAKVESEKRRIISIAIDEFRNFSNSSKSLDERSYKSLLSKIKIELEKFTRSDSNIRKMTGAQPYQSTDEAVAKLLE